MKICSATGCRTFIAKKKVFCPKHWSLIPWRYRVTLCILYQRGQFERGAPDPRWSRGVRELIDYLECLDRPIPRVPLHG